MYREKGPLVVLVVVPTVNSRFVHFKTCVSPSHSEEAKLTPLVSTLAYNASVSLAMNFTMLARLTLC